jgi:hypothetical protein
VCDVKSPHSKVAAIDNKLSIGTENRVTTAHNVKGSFLTSV